MQILGNFAHSKNYSFQEGKKKSQKKRIWFLSVDYKMVKTSNTKKSLTRKKNLNDFWHYFIHQVGVLNRHLVFLQDSQTWSHDMKT